MSIMTRDSYRYGYPSAPPSEVIALLVNDGSAGAVAAVAVHEAAERRAPIRFLQLVSPDHDQAGRSLAEETMFKAALHALHGHTRTHSVFEVVASQVSAVVRRRSRDAALIVVGVDPGDGSSLRHSLAHRCEVAASCPVRTVSIAR